MDEAKRVLEVARVTVSKWCLVPPNSVKHIRCKLNCEMQDFIVEADEDIGVLVPKTLMKVEKRR